eukprot:scaffold8700_cov31-Tisochrysis_lutea.AAC.11
MGWLCGRDTRLARNGGEGKEDHGNVEGHVTVPASITRRRVSATAVWEGSVACTKASGLPRSSGNTDEPLPQPSSRTRRGLAPVFASSAELVPSIMAPSGVLLARSCGNICNNALRSLKKGVGAAACL